MNTSIESFIKDMDRPAPLLHHLIPLIARLYLIIRIILRNQSLRLLMVSLSVSLRVPVDLDSLKIRTILNPPTTNAFRLQSQSGDGVADFFVDISWKSRRGSQLHNPSQEDNHPDAVVHSPCHSALSNPLTMNLKVSFPSAASCPYTFISTYLNSPSSI